MGLTRQEIQAAAADGRKLWLADGKVPGLGVMVLPSGVRTWYLRYREPSGKQQTHKIGRADVISPAAAREEAHKLLGAVAKGEQPTTARQRLRQAPTVAQLLERIKREHWRRLKPGTQRNNELAWRLHLLPTFGAMKVAEVQPRHVADWFHHASLERPIRANRCLEILSKAFNLAELWGLRSQASNPCARIDANPENKRRRYLKPEEAARLGRTLAIWQHGTRWRFAQLVRLLLLTGCRLREIMACRWEWIDLRGRVIHLPDSKTGARTVHLTPQAVAILEQLRAATNTDWVIAGAGDGPMVGYRKLWLELCEQAEIQQLRIHDLRHSFASFGLASGLTLPVIGSLLGHASPQTTARYAHLIDEVAQAAAATTGAAVSLALAG